MISVEHIIKTFRISWQQQRDMAPGSKSKTMDAVRGVRFTCTPGRVFTLLSPHVAAALLCVFGWSSLSAQPDSLLQETPRQKEQRLQWWREARFGLFIHWGLYSVPAGEWKGETSHGEWIRETAQIPIHEYEKFVPQFNPVKFNAAEWVRAAKQAGMKYIVITSKHHDGFCLFDSRQTDFDVMSTPFKRDIMKELSEACAREGMKICWYHSIMDWHHPDYLPRRTWEEKDRPAGGANYDRFVQYLKAQLKELTTNYGPIGVLWFDGEWEKTWTEERGRDLYVYVRSLQPSIIINNRVGAARSGMGGFTPEGSFAGDFGTPEQQIPATGLPGVDWETCMTMNDHWGYNKNDHNWKSSKELLQNLADIASKGGNFLLNIGPTAEGVFPPESIERLRTIGDWMKVNGDAIYGTTASPFRTLAWGRCTQEQQEGKTRLYLHVFDWPKDGKLVVPGLLNQPVNAYLLSDAARASLKTAKTGVDVTIEVPKNAPDAVNSVVVLDINGVPATLQAAEFTRVSKGDGLEIALTPTVKDPEYRVRFTTDGSVPTAKSAEMKEPVKLQFPSVFRASAFYKDMPFGDVTMIDIPLSVGKSVRLATPPSEKYKADGAQTLTDGLFGSNEYSDGKWLGFEQDDFEAVVDLGQSVAVKSISLSYLAASAAWIFAPVEITYAVSEDGKTFRAAGTIKKDAKNWKDEKGANTFSKELSGVKARYVKVSAKNMGTCPDDHAGRGGKAWLFVDEISVR